MSNLNWLNEDHMILLQPYFPKSRGLARVDDRRVSTVLLLAIAMD